MTGWLMPSVRSRGLSRRAGLAFVGAAGLLCAVLAPPGIATNHQPAIGETLVVAMDKTEAIAGDPDDPFALPEFGPLTVIASPEQLRTGGTNCARPDPLHAKNAGERSDHAYRVPFLMALSDGRALAGYNAAAKAYGQMPFGTGAMGMTGWARGWVELPSLKVVVPDDGVKLCPGAEAYWSTLATGTYPPGQPRGSYWGLSAYPGGFLGTRFEYAQNGPVKATLAGVGMDGYLQFRAEMPIRLRLETYYSFNPDASTMDCVTETTLTLETNPSALVERFRPIPTPWPDPSMWNSPEEYEAHFRSDYPVGVEPPDRYHMPPQALDSASTGAPAALADAHLSISVAQDNPSNPGQCSPENRNGVSTVANILTPKDGQGDAPINRDNAIRHVKHDNVGWEIQPGAVHASIDLTITDVGMQAGLPSGFGFR